MADLIDKRDAYWLDENVITKRSKRGVSFEKEVLKAYGGVSQVPFLDGEICYGKGMSVVDIARVINDNTIELIECKSTNPFECGDFYQLSFRLKSQLEKLKKNMPRCAIIRIVLEDFGFSNAEKEDIRQTIWHAINTVQYGIKIDFLKRGEKR